MREQNDLQRHPITFAGSRPRPARKRREVAVGMDELWTHSATALASGIARGDFSSADVVSAHVERIRAVNGALRAVVVTRFDEALAEARDVDERRARGEDIGALGGVPVTIKECLDVAGTPSTFGLPSRRERSRRA